MTDVSAVPACADLLRRYDAAAADAASATRRLAEDDFTGRMQAVADTIWRHLAQAGVSWVGFYCPERGSEEPSSEHLVLGPSRNTPACSPIGLHGVCGRSYLSRTACVVEDVRQLGGSYVACDPRDRSEVVVPIVVGTGSAARCVAVLDLDSHEVGRFGPTDVDGLRAVLWAAGLPA